MSMRVKLCWRPRGKGVAYSAVQLIAKIRTDDWEGELQAFVDRARFDGVTHFLFAQRERDEITEAALVPAQDIIRIWCSQRDLSRELIRQGQLGRRKKNHAMNGSSPTLWLADVAAPSVTDALWKDPSVQDLVTFNPTGSEYRDDTYADLDGIDVALLGSDGAGRLEGRRSYVKRDPRVRLYVLERAGGACERCKASRPFIGFLDVHHILGAETSDRVWNCVAICPNCHREAHFALDFEAINSTLLAWALQFKPKAA
jgi:5-methylcytosine-specific restriction protein A